MPYLDGLTLAWFFRAQVPSARVVLMSTDESPDCVKLAKRRARLISFTRKISGKSSAQ